jgi:hypothetical protein
MEKTSVWILFSVANNYDQPESAFEKLWWQKPTAEELGKHLGMYPDSDPVAKLFAGEKVRNDGTYWLEEFVKH